MAVRHAPWREIVERLAPARSYWLATTDESGAPHVTPVWGVVHDETLHVYSERRTAKARHVRSELRVAVHLESAEDVLIVHGELEDLGLPQQHPAVMDALDAKYSAPDDAAYLPTVDPDFDVLWALRPTRALLWTLADFEGTQARWSPG